jgi:glycosyltransferase involved in cell wall biosynthesis
MLMTSDSPWLVTAIVTTYQRPELVRRAVVSVVEQTHKPLQIIVVEDGSDVGLEDWLQEQGLDHVSYERHGDNRGLAAARNTGLRLSRGEYVAYLDDDDEWKPTRIEEQVALLKDLPEDRRRAVGVVYCGTEVRSPGGSVRAIGHPVNRGKLREAIVREGAITLSSSFLFSKEALQRVGGYDEKLRSSVDHDIWMSLAAHGYEALTLDRPLVVKYQTDHPKMTTDTATRVEGVRTYVEKWRPTYRDWLGDDAGDAYADRYFISVIGVLAAGKLVEGKLRQAWRAARAMLALRGRRLFALRTLVRQTAAVAAHRFLPGGAVKVLRGVKGSLNHRGRG